MICLSVDVEWAAPEVLADLVGLLDERGLKATFFCTHAGVSVPGHERGIHPNFRRQGDTVKLLRSQAGEERFGQIQDEEVYEHVVRTTMSYAPEALGVRAHSLYYDSQLLPIYQKAGLKYDSSYLLPMAQDLRPFPKEYGILELPIYYNDFYDLKSGMIGFDLSRIPLGGSGLKVFNFHPNTVFTNVSTLAEYGALKAHYKDPDKLVEARKPGRGARTLFVELLDAIVRDRLPTSTMASVASGWAPPSAPVSVSAGGRKP